jgi:hypothetical protein
MGLLLGFVRISLGDRQDPVKSKGIIDCHRKGPSADNANTEVLALSDAAA